MLESLALILVSRLGFLQKFVDLFCFYLVKLSFEEANVELVILDLAINRSLFLLNFITNHFGHYVLEMLQLLYLMVYQLNLIEVLIHHFLKDVVDENSSLRESLVKHMPELSIVVQNLSNVLGLIVILLEFLFVLLNVGDYPDQLDLGDCVFQSLYRLFITAPDLRIVEFNASDLLEKGVLVVNFFLNKLVR